jgi:hypothetical protein
LEKECYKGVQSGFSFESEAFDLLNCFDISEHLEYSIESIENVFEVCKNVVIYAASNRAVENPVRMVTRGSDEVPIDVRLSSGWKRRMQSRLKCNLLEVDTFYELTPRIADKLLFSNHFKSFKAPCGGLTI